MAERRAIKEVEEKHFTGFLSAIEEIVGAAIEVEVNWTSLHVEGRSNYYEAGWPPIFFETTEKTLREICVDDMGKEAVQEGLKKIIFKNEEDHSNPNNAFNFEDGVLTFDHKLSNEDQVNARVEKLIEILEAGL